MWRYQLIIFTDLYPLLLLASVLWYHTRRYRLQHLIKKHGDNYVAMARDIKVNIMQDTATQLEKRIKLMTKLQTLGAADTDDDDDDDSDDDAEDAEDQDESAGPVVKRSRSAAAPVDIAVVAARKGANLLSTELKEEAVTRALSMIDVGKLEEEEFEQLFTNFDESARNDAADDDDDDNEDDDDDDVAAGDIDDNASSGDDDEDGNNNGEDDADEDDEDEAASAAIAAAIAAKAKSDAKKAAAKAAAVASAEALSRRVALVDAALAKAAKKPAAGATVASLAAEVAKERGLTEAEVKRVRKHHRTPN